MNTHVQARKFDADLLSNFVHSDSPLLLNPTTHSDLATFAAASARAGIIEVVPEHKRNNACPVRDPMLSMPWVLRNLNDFPNEVKASFLQSEIELGKAFSHRRKQFWLRLIVVNFLLHPDKARLWSGLAGGGCHVRCLLRVCRRHDPSPSRQQLPASRRPTPRAPLN